MKLPRRNFLHLAAGAAAVPAASHIAWAQAYPARPVRWIVGFPSGGGNDMVARLMGQWLSERLGQPFVIESRPGAAAISPPRQWCVPPRMDTRCCLCPEQPLSMRRSTKSSISISSATSRPWRASSVCPMHGGTSIDVGQDGSRVHCLCQGQSGQDQHGVARRRYLASSRRRAVQDDGRYRHGSRAVSRLRAGTNRVAISTAR